MLHKLFIKILVFTVLIYNTSYRVYSSNTSDDIQNNNISLQNKINKKLEQKIYNDNEESNNNSNKKSKNKENIKLKKAKTSEDNIQENDIKTEEDNNTDDTDNNIDEEDSDDENKDDNDEEADNDTDEENNDTDNEDNNDEEEDNDTDEEDSDTDNEDDNDEEEDNDTDEEDSDDDDEEEDSVYDPFEKFNRKVFEFNETMNGLLDKVMPQNKDKSKPSVIFKGIGNFSHNFLESPRIINYILQGNVKNTSNSIARLMINTLFGFFGVADVAEKLGFEKKNTNFGDTLKKWGMKPGPYVVLPVLGPTSLRGTVGQVLEIVSSSVAKLPLRHMKPFAKNVTYYGIYCCSLLSKRAAYGGMIEQVASMSKDKYKTFRSITMSSESN